MNLPPELTARIEDTVGTVWPKAVYPLQHAVAVRILETFAEPLHKEIEAIRGQLADTEASRQEYIRLFHGQERENDELEAQLAEAKKAAEAELAQWRSFYTSKNQQVTSELCEIELTHQKIRNILNNVAAS